MTAVDYFEGLDVDRVKALLEELTLNQLVGLVLAKVAMERQVVTFHIRPVEARVRTKRYRRSEQTDHYCRKRPQGLEGECQFSLSSGLCLHCGRAVGMPHG